MAASQGLSPKEKNVFMGHCAIVAAAIAYILPLDLIFGIDIKTTAFSMMVWLSVLASMYTIYSNYGLPALLPWKGFQGTMQALMPWFARVNMSTDFQMLFFALIYISSDTNILVGVILFRRSLWTIGTFGSTKLANNSIWQKVAPLWLSLQANQAAIMEQATFAEIILGFSQIMFLLTPARRILTTFLHWQWLKMRYMMDKSGRHKTVWAKIDAKTSPYVNKVPVLPMVVGYVKNWFTAPPQTYQMPAGQAQ